MTETTTAQYVKVSIEDRVATVTIDHPPVNALNKQTLQELDAAMRQLADDPAVKVIVLAAAGQMAFVAGADIGEMAAVKSVEEAETFLRLGQETFTRIENMRKPVIAAINGVALGGGLELAMACHMRISGDRVQFGQPEIDLGIIPGFGGTQRLPRIVGPAKAAEIILTGKRITAQEALRLNLVNKVVPGGEVLKTARDMARVIAEKSALAIAAAMEAIDGGWRGNLDAGLAGEAAAFQTLSKGEDWHEGMTAFLEKRRPQFKDK